jgi:hypothetical protein
MDKLYAGQGDQIPKKNKGRATQRLELIRDNMCDLVTPASNQQKRYF